MKSVLDGNNCWMLQIIPENADTVYHARAYVTVDGETSYGDVKDVKLSELESGVSLIANLEGFEPGINDILDEIAAGMDSGNNSSGGYSGGGSGTTTYVPTISETQNGTVTVDPKAPKAGDKVTITVKPDAGYEADAVTVTDAKGKAVEVTKNADGTYSFTQPDSKVTINATFKKTAASGVCPKDGADCPLAAFTDLDPMMWYHDGIAYCLKNGVMNGVGNGRFDPDGVTTRGMIVTILYRMEGEPVIRSGMPFDDVTESDWYAKAVSWAESLGIVNGYGDGKFGPNDPITREQLAAILYRYAQYKGLGFQGLWSFRLDFPDAGEVSDWATEAVSWMVMNGVINGKDGKLVPGGEASRAEAATMIQRFCEKIAE